MTGDDVSVTAGTAAFADKNAGNKAVTLSGFALAGTKAGNYILAAQPEGVTAKITPKALTATVTAVNRAYEKGNVMVALNAGTLSGVLTGDEVSLDATTAVGTMADANAGADKPVTVTGLALSGKDAGNYSLTQPEGVTVTISKADLSSPSAELIRTYLYTEAAKDSVGISGYLPADSGTAEWKAPVTEGTVSYKTAPAVADGALSWTLNAADGDKNGGLCIWRNLRSISLTSGRFWESVFLRNLRS